MCPFMVVLRLVGGERLLATLIAAGIRAIARMTEKMTR
jgi:hypothetical protein